MGSRFRTRQFSPNPPGTATYTGINLTQSDSITGTPNLVYESCSDVTMPRPYTVDHGLSIVKIVHRPSFLNGRKYINASYGYYQLNNYRKFPAGVGWPNITWTPFDTNYFRTLALANISPYRSQVNLPLFISEMREIPEMVHQMGRILKREAKPTDVAGGYLAYSFGWAPLVGDLLSLFDMTKKIEDRKAYFRKLESGTRVRRQLGTRVVRNTPAFLTDSAGHIGSTESAVIYRGKLNLVETQKVWYTANAKLRNPLHMNNAELHSFTRRQLLGLRLNPADLWDAIPWSWLNGYFNNFADILEAVNGMVSVSTTRMNLMCLSKIIVSVETVKLQDGITLDPGFIYATNKQRFPYANPTPMIAAVPFFTNHMAGIIGSLAVVKALKASGIR